MKKENYKFRKGQIDMEKAIMGIIIVIVFFSLIGVFFGTTGLGNLDFMAQVPIWLVLLLPLVVIMAVIYLVLK